MDPDYPEHNDFVVVKKEAQFGGYEVLHHKDAALAACFHPRAYHSCLFLTTHHNQASSTKYYRKAVTPISAGEFDDMYVLSVPCGSRRLTPFFYRLKWKNHLIADKTFATIHPTYEYGGRKWVVISITEDAEDTT